MARILLVDDEPLLLESLEIILSISGEHEVCGKAQNGLEALGLLKDPTCVPDVMLVDLNMPDMGGNELIPIVKAKYPDIRIIVLTTFYDEQNIAGAISGGAVGYLLKDSGKDAILNAVEQALKGQSVLDIKVMQKLNAMLSSEHVETSETKSTLSDARSSARTYSSEPKQKIEDWGITDREKEICKLICEGCTNAQIASILFISEGTVKNYVSSIYDKLDEHDRTKLAIRLQSFDL